MTSKFAPAPIQPGFILPTLTEIPLPTVGGDFSQPTSNVDALIAWHSIQGSALLALLLRAAYLSDDTYLALVCPFIPGYVSYTRLTDAALGDFRPVVIDCGHYRTVVLHGLRNDVQYRSVALDLIIPRYTMGPYQFPATAGGPGQFFADWWAINQPESVPVNLACHSFGGILGAYWNSRKADSGALAKTTLFGVPKLGVSGAKGTLDFAPIKAWATREDPVIGLPPSYIRLPDVAFVVAQFVPVFASMAAAAVKRKLDGQWSVLESAVSNVDSLNQDNTVGELRDVDNGLNWYTRTGLGVSSIILGPGQRASDSHKIATYYGRLRGLFDNWSILSDAAGPGGRGADVAALAISAAELMEAI